MSRVVMLEITFIFNKFMAYFNTFYIVFRQFMYNSYLTTSIYGLKQNNWYMEYIQGSIESHIRKC